MQVLPQDGEVSGDRPRAAQRATRDLLFQAMASKRAAKRVAGSMLAASPKRTAAGPILTIATAASASAAPLLSLGSADLVEAVFVRRPSARNKSPYVADIRLSDGREAIAHCPSMDMGGKLKLGVKVLVRTAVDKAGKPVGSEAMGKFGTPKCEFIMLLLRCEEPENMLSGGCWVGAHPSLGEQIADSLLRSGRLNEELGGTITQVQREVTAVAGTDMRCDFLLTLEDNSRIVLEVKTVVDTDYNPALQAPSTDLMASVEASSPSTTPKGKSYYKKAKADQACVFLGRPERTGGRYSRSAIFPWGRSAQIGPEGEKVVSARAIKHVRELMAIVKGERVEADGGKLAAAVLFIVVRSDAERFRPNAEACPSFARYIREAHDAGVLVLSHRVRWGDAGAELGQAFHDGAIPFDLD